MSGVISDQTTQISKVWFYFLFFIFEIADPRDCDFSFSGFVGMFSFDVVLEILVIWVLEQTMIEGMVCSFLYVVRFWKCYVDPTCEKTFSGAKCRNS
jgi:hypothetical protein